MTTEDDGLLESAMAEYAAKNYDRLADEHDAMKRRAESAEAERDALLAERRELRALLAQLLPWADAWRKLGETQHGPMPAMAKSCDDARALLAKTERTTR